MNWYHKKFRGTVFKGSYEIDRKGERTFVLTTKLGKGRRITFESWQMAARDGWVRKSWSI